MSVVVVGGGLTGLVAAERLTAAGVEAAVLEREAEPGGACRSLEVDGFTFDYTGHLLHVGRPETERYLGNLGVWRELELHDRRSAVVVGGCATPYPVQIHTHGLAPEVRRDCLLGFIRAWARSDRPEPESFRDWVLDRFGDGLARHFFFPYNEKLYRASCEELTLDWVGRYVPKPDLEEVVDGALGLHENAVGYNVTFRYPRTGGIRLLADAIATAVPDLRLGHEVTAISRAERWVETAAGDRLSYDALVATLALPRLVDLLVDPLPEEVVEARRALRWVSVVNLALGVEGPPPRDEHWLYFPDPELPFYRVGFPSSHGRLAPEGHHTVSVEVSLPPGVPGADAVADDAERALVGAGLVDPSRIRVRSVAGIDPAYVVFDRPRRQAVATLRRFLGDAGVLLSGRWAEWKYSAMEDAVLDGMAVARRLIRGRRPGS